MKNATNCHTLVRRTLEMTVAGLIGMTWTTGAVADLQPADTGFGDATPAPAPPIGDDMVDSLDPVLCEILAAWSMGLDDPYYDYNGDGTLDVNDVLDVIATNPMGGCSVLDLLTVIGEDPIDVPFDPSVPIGAVEVIAWGIAHPVEELDPVEIEAVMHAFAQGIPQADDQEFFDAQAGWTGPLDSDPGPGMDFSYVPGESIATPTCSSDCGADGAVDTLDLLELLEQWGQLRTAHLTCDAGGDGRVDVEDLLELLASWGTCP